MLGGRPFPLHGESTVELSWAMVAVFGDKYINDPKIPKLAARNQLTMLDFMDGKSEADALARGDYAAIQRSTIRKVQLLSEFLNLAATNRLRTDRWEQNIVAWIASRPWTRWAVPIMVRSLVSAR